MPEFKKPYLRGFFFGHSHPEMTQATGNSFIILTMTWIPYFSCVLGAYLIGAIPFGFLIAKKHGVDLREHGSGNIGATNVGRVLGKKWGLTCFAFDVFKGLVPTLAIAFIANGGEYFTNNMQLAAWLWLSIGVATIAGHCFPVFLKFKGGKGVATSLGMLLGLCPVFTLPAIAGFILWIVCVQLTAYVGLSSVIAAITLPIGTAFSCMYFQQPMLPFISIATLLALLVTWRHRSNLRNMYHKTESRVGWGWRGKKLLNQQPSEETTP